MMRKLRTPYNAGPWQRFFMGDAYLKNRDQIINVGVIGHGHAEDTKLLGGSGGMLPWKNFEILNPQFAGNALKLSILPPPRYFVSF